MPARFTNNPYEWPLNLVYDISLEDDDLYKNPPSDINPSVEYVLYLLEETFTPQSAEVIKLRYRDKLTFKEIGDHYGVCGQRIRAIIDKAILFMHHPMNAKYIKYGITKFIKMEIAETAKNSYIKGYYVGAHHSKTISESGLNPYTAVPIEMLGLSIGTTLKLQHADIKTIQDILNQDIDSLMKLMGRRRYLEIIYMLEENGFSCDHYYDRG